MKIFFYSILSFYSLLLTACGFHLQTTNLNLHALGPLYLESNQAYGPFEQVLRSHLNRAEVKLTHTPLSAKTILKIINQSIQQTMVARSISGLSSQNNITLTISYQITDSNGKLLMPIQNVSVSRSYAVNNTQTLGSTNEQDRVIQDLQRNVATLILAQLSSFNPSRHSF